MVTFGLLGRCLDGMYRKDLPDTPETPGTQGTQGQALAIYDLGADVKKVDVPLQLITTAKDPLSGTFHTGRLFNKSSDESNAWYHFKEGEGVPHAMVSPLENKNEESLETIYGILTDFMGEGKGTNRRPGAE